MAFPKLVQRREPRSRNRFVLLIVVWATGYVLFQQSRLVVHVGDLEDFDEPMDDDDALDENGSIRSRINLQHPSVQPGFEYIRVIGERHSGTKFITKQLQECFGHALNVGTVATVNKHWMQRSPEYIRKAVSDFEKGGILPASHPDAPFSWLDIAKHEQPPQLFQSTLVVALFRDPFDWMEAMRRKPHHWPNHGEYEIVNASTPTEQQRHEDIRQRRRLQQSNFRSGVGHTVQINSAMNTGIQSGTPISEMLGKLRKAGDTRRQRPRLEVADKLLDKPMEGPRRASRTKKTNKLKLDFVPLPWQEFVQRPLYLTDEASRTNSSWICQKGYYPGTISPCVRNQRYIPVQLRDKVPPSVRMLHVPHQGTDPVYELHPFEQRPFYHPLELRAAKLRNTMEFAQQWKLGHFLPIQYETIVPRGTKFVVDQVEAILGIPPLWNCTYAEPQQLTHYPIDDDFRDWIMQNADWEAEKLVGYKPRR